VVAAYGTSITAAYGVGNQIIGVVIFIALWFSMAATTLAWQYYGAKDFHNIIKTKEYSLLMSVGVLIFLWVIIFAFARPLVNIFVPGEVEVIEVSVQFLHIVALFLWSYGIQFVITGMFRGLWEVKVPMIITLLTLWCLQIPIAYFGGKMYGAVAIWRSVPLANVIATGVARVWYESWKKKKLMQQ
jgi:Na+-driven multidrug efflux pump